MAELRWILLVVGVAFCLGLWWWETRRRTRSAGSLRNPDSLQEFDPPHGSDDDIRLDIRVDDTRLTEEELTEVPSYTRRSSPRIEPTFDSAPIAPQALVERPDPALEAEPQPNSAAAGQEQKILSLRLLSGSDSPFDGRELREALQDAGLTHGKFSIFHRQTPEGLTLFSVASLTEPGSFDLQTMDQQAFRGITFFAVLADAGEEGAAEMQHTAQDIATKLRGTLSGGR